MVRGHHCCKEGTPGGPRRSNKGTPTAHVLAVALAVGTLIWTLETCQHRRVKKGDGGKRERTLEDKQPSQ